MEAAFFGRSCRTVSNFPRFKVDQKKIRGTKYKIRCKIKISPFVCKHFHSRDSYFSSCPHYRLCMYVRINLYKLQRNIYKYTYITCMRANLYLYINYYLYQRVQQTLIFYVWRTCGRNPYALP